MPVSHVAGLPLLVDSLWSRVFRYFGVTGDLIEDVIQSAEECPGECNND
jgi:hypothetical protein